MFVFVVPCYNEANRWNDAYWQRVLQICNTRWIFVDDGSTDGTARLAAQSARWGTAEVLGMKTNAGKAESVRRGMLRALEQRSSTQISGLGFMDADGAFVPEDIENVLSVFEDQTRGGAFEAVWTSRVALSGRDIERSELRHYFGRGVSTLMGIGNTRIPYDTQSGLKIFTPDEVLEECLIHPFKTRWLFELELINRSRALRGEQLRIWEEPLSSWTEVGGSKVTLRESMRIAREILVIKREQRSVARSLKTRSLPPKAGTGFGS